jgi:hypothetical protein
LFSLTVDSMLRFAIEVAMVSPDSVLET